MKRGGKLKVMLQILKKFKTKNFAKVAKIIQNKFETQLLRFPQIFSSFYDFFLCLLRFSNISNPLSYFMYFFCPHDMLYKPPQSYTNGVRSKKILQRSRKNKTKLSLPPIASETKVFLTLNFPSPSFFIACCFSAFPLSNGVLSCKTIALSIQ